MRPTISLPVTLVCALGLTSCSRGPMPADCLFSETSDAVSYEVSALPLVLGATGRVTFKDSDEYALMAQVGQYKKRCPLEYQSGGLLVYGACSFELSALTTDRDAPWIQAAETLEIVGVSSNGRIMHSNKLMMQRTADGFRPAATAPGTIWRFRDEKMCFRADDKVYVTERPGATITFEYAGVKTDGIRVTSLNGSDK